MRRDKSTHRSRFQSVVRKIRRRLAKLIGPPDLDYDPKYDIPIDIGLKGAAELRKELHIDEQPYLLIAGQSFADPRAYVLYTVLDELKKASIYLMRLKEYFQDGPINPRKDRIDRLMQEHILEEQDARFRRLLEVLLVLILFDRTNEQLYYRHFLLLEQLDEFLASNFDLEEFYGSRSSNIDDSIDRQINWIREIEEKVDIDRCWYLRKRVSLPRANRLRPGMVLSSMRSRIKDAMPNMTEQEKLIFGFSYWGGYGRTSGGIHYSPGRINLPLRPGQELSAVAGLGLLILSILDRCHRLLGRPDVPIAKKISAFLEQKDPDALVQAITVGKIELGDFVLAYGNLAEVLEIKQSQFGYRSYKVRYLAEKPKPDIQEDWFPALHIRLLFKRSQFYKAVKQMVDEGKLKSDFTDHLGKLSDDEVQAILRQSMTNMWHLGLKNWARGKPPRPKS